MSSDISPVHVYTPVFSRTDSLYRSTASRKKTNDDSGDKTIRATASAVANLAKNTEALSMMIDGLDLPSGTAASLFRTASVSDSGRASAQVEDGAKMTSHSLDIDRLATAKTTRSVPLRSDSITELSEGTHLFALTVDDNTYEFSITVDTSGLSPDTNKDVLQKLANAISGADSSIEAFVSEGSRKVYSMLAENLTENIASLTVRTKDTGDSPDFSLSDGSGGSLVENLGLNSTAMSGKTSLYSLDAVSGESGANTITSDSERLTIQLLEKTAAPVTIQVKGGVDPVYNEISERIAAYNSYVNWFDRNSEYINPAVKEDMVEDVSSIEEQLSAIGLKLTDNGSVYITDEFLSAIKTDIGTVRQTLTGSNGFFTKVSATLNEIKARGAVDYVRNKKQLYGYSSVDFFI